MDGKKVLITGGLGFIGSNLAIRLARAGAEVYVLDALLPGYGGNMFNLRPVQEKVQVNISDMADEYALRYFVTGQDYIFNLAGQVSHLDSMQDPYHDLEINARAQISLLEACRKYNPEATVVYASTRQFYGRPRKLPVDEEHPIDPPDINGIHKYAGETYHMLYHKVYGLKTVALRLTNTYGPRQLIRNARQGFIGWFINRTVTGEPIELFGGGEQVRDFNYVDDVVEAFLMAAGEKLCHGKFFNLSGEKASLGQVAGMLVDIAGSGDVRKVPFPEERQRIDIGDFYGDSSLFRKITGWQCRTGLEEGLARTVAYYMKYREHYLDEEVPLPGIKQAG